MCVCGSGPRAIPSSTSEMGGRRGGRKERRGREKKGWRGNKKKDPERGGEPPYTTKKSCECKRQYFARVYKGDGGTKRRGGVTMLLRVDCHWVTRINNKRCFGQRSRSRPMCYRLVLLRCLR